MNAPGHPRPLQIGAPAPDFTLMRADGDRQVSLADYRGTRSLLLGLFRGVYCAFCRRAVAKLALTGDRLRGLGVETLGVVGTSLDNARLYFRYHPPRIAMAADPDLVTHRAYGLPKVEATSEAVRAMRVNPSGELPEALPVWEATKALGRLDGFKPTDTDRDDVQRTWSQTIGEFLIDRDGIVRWIYVEGATAADYCARFPSEEGLLVAARALSTSPTG